MGSKPTKAAMVSGLPFYLWAVPDKPVSIQLHFDAIDRMSPDILRGLGALKRRGAEVGGILLGRLEGPGVVVEDFEPVVSEYLTGPSYNLSANDLVAFEAAMERRKSDTAGKLSVVGFYRSHTRDELYMDDADIALARRYFSEPRNVFLIIKPFATRPCVGGFFFWEDGEIARGSSYLQFPFERRELGGGEPPLPEPVLATPQAEVSPRRGIAVRDSPLRDAPLPPYTPLVERGTAPTTPVEEPRLAMRVPSFSMLTAPEAAVPVSSKRWWRWLLVPGFLAIAGVAGFFAYRTIEKASASQAAEPALPLRLSVSERSSQLDVTWDRNAPAVTSAKRGVLSISDGSKRRDLELSGTQLRNGRVLYSRLSGDVNLRLEVFPEGQASVVESIRVVSTDAPPSASRPQVSIANPAKKMQTRTAPESPALSAPSRPAVDTAPKTPVTAAQPEVELPRPERRR